MSWSEVTNLSANYQLLLEEQLKSIPEGSRLLLHCCCAPCASYVLEYLSPKLDTTAFYYNPNLYPPEEYDLRADELRRFIELSGVRAGLVIAPYDPGVFSEAVRGAEDSPEGGQRCSICFSLRLAKTAQWASSHGFHYIATTLTISPLKNAALINELGSSIAGQNGVKWLYSDFKKRGGFQRSTELSAKYGLYRQNYCGCIYSKR